MGPHAVADGRRLHRPAPHTGVAARRVHQDVESAAVERGRDVGDDRVDVAPDPHVGNVTSRLAPWLVCSR